MKSSDDLIFTPMPGSASVPTFRTQAVLTPLVCDERAIARLLETLLDRAGLSRKEAARRLGMGTEGVRAYLSGRRTRPSLLWFLRFVSLCNARIYLEFPPETLKR